MASLKQIAANRANAKASTGPKTQEGKAASSHNSTRHGLLAATICLKAEDKPRFEALVASFTAQFEPRNPAEAALVESLAIARWHRMRIWAIQKANFEVEMASVPDSSGSAAVRAALAFRKLADQSHTLQLLQRYDTAYERQYNRAFNILTRLRASNPDTAAPDPFLPNLPLESGTFPDSPTTVASPTGEFPSEANFPEETSANRLCSTPVHDQPRASSPPDAVRPTPFAQVDASVKPYVKR
jgi:hypothetical protein